MIFFGTEPPAQPEDPIHISPFNDLSNNIDETSSQWRDMQDVSISKFFLYSIQIQIII